MDWTTVIGKAIEELGMRDDDRVVSVDRGKAENR